MTQVWNMLPAKKFLAAVSVCSLLFQAALTAAAEPAGQILTNAADVLSLSAAQAAHRINISIEGVVTAAETNWGGRFFVQDSTAGVFVDNSSGTPQPVPGDVVAVTGTSHPGGYAPVVSRPHWKKLGTAPLPEAKVVVTDQLATGAEDGQRIEISGVVRAVRTSGSKLEVEMVSDGYRLRVYPPIPTDLDVQSLVGANVRVKGTAAASFNGKLRHFITVIIFTPQLGDFIVERPATSDPFKEEVIPLNGIAQYRKDHSPDNRVHVRGVVTYQRNGEDLFLQDAVGGLQVKSSQTNILSPGDVIDAVGFPGVENFLPVLEDAIFKKSSATPTNVIHKTASGTELQDGFHHADFINLKGKLIDRLARGFQSAPGGAGAVKTILVLQNTNFLFTAEKETADQDAFLSSIPIGSIVEVSGICLLQSADDGKIKSIQILLPTSDSVRIISRPGWLTPQHLSVMLAIVLLVLTVAVSWTIMVSKKNSTLRYLIHERESDQKELQKAHDTLEWRVKERTEQLKFQITARKESELQFKATLAERTRLAQELHDTLEQTLTGITLQLDTVAKLFHSNLDGASHHLGLVRNLMRQSQVDLRRSIWDLRSRELEDFNLSKALLTSAHQIGDSAGIRISVQTAGIVRPLPEVVEENLLRIGQEAITNVVKHSGASQAEIKLEFGARTVVLEIKDDGKGFMPENCVGPNDGHFGLLGISERSSVLAANCI
jgi:signal transduction histidine kinase